MSKNAEYLLHNSLKKDTQTALKPFLLIESIFVVSKCRIKDNFVTPNTKTYCFLNILFTLFILGIYVYDGLIRPCRMETFCMILTQFYCLIHRFIDTWTVIFQSAKYVQFLIKVQKIDNRLIDAGAPSVLTLSNRNVWCVTILVVLYVTFIAVIMAMSKISFGLILSMICLFSSVVFDLDVLYSAFVKNFLASKLDAWADIMWNRVRLEENSNHLEHDRSEVNGTLMLSIVKDVLDVWKMWKTLYQISILHHVGVTFYQWMVNVHVIISWAKFTLNDDNVKGTLLSRSTVVILWSLKSQMIEILLCVACHRLNSSILKTKKICLVVLASRSEKDDYRRMAKNVIRLCNSNYSKIRLCGLISLDEALPLRIVGVVATYCIVQLQFAFLKSK